MSEKGLSITEGPFSFASVVLYCNPNEGSALKVVKRMGRPGKRVVAGVVAVLPGAVPQRFCALFGVSGKVACSASGTGKWRPLYVWHSRVLGT
jgi:hypothetical protein